MISEALQMFISGIVLFVFGLCLLFFPNKFQEQAIRDYQRFPWRHLALFGNRVDKPGYLIEIRIGGIVALSMGIIVLAIILFSHSPATEELLSSNVPQQNVYQKR